MSQQTQIFDDAAEVKKVVINHRKWLVPFLEGKSIVVESYPWGQHENPYKAPAGVSSTSISILIDGFIEVYEEHFIECGKRSRRAYRPIKILETGDIFDDFGLVDQFVFEGKQKPLNEEWGIAYGGRSALLFVNRGSIEKDLFVLEPNRRNRKADYSLHNLLSNSLRNKDAVVKVARFDTTQLDSAARTDLLAHVMKLAWKKAYTYRQCANSYNVQERFRFLQQAKQQTEQMGTNARLSTAKMRKAVTGADYPSEEEKNATLAEERVRVEKIKLKALYDYRVNYDDIIDIFIDSLYDAINRPVRDEPVYAENRFISEHYDLSLLGTRCTTLFPIRISQDNGPNVFYFPLGLANFLMCNYVSLFDNENDKFSFFDGMGAEALLKPSVVAGKMTKGNKSHFWFSVAHKILVFHRDQDTRDNPVKRLLQKPYRLSLSVELKRDFNDDYDLMLVFTKMASL